MVVIREDYLAVCDGNHCAAALLSIFEYWTNVKLGQQEQAQVENAIAAAGGAPSVRDDLWVFKSVTDLETDLMGLFGKMKIGDALKLIRDKGFVERRTNPDYRWDRTLQYHLQIEMLQGAISDTPLPKNGQSKQPKSGNGKPKNGQAIPKTTPKTPSETTAELKEKDLVPSGTSGESPKKQEPQPATIQEKASGTETPTETPSPPNSAEPPASPVEVGQIVWYDANNYQLGVKDPPILAAVVKLTAQRVRIRFYSRDEKQVVERAVQAVKLTPRTTGEAPPMSQFEIGQEVLVEGSPIVGKVVALGGPQRFEGKVCVTRPNPKTPGVNMTHWIRADRVKPAPPGAQPSATTRLVNFHDVKAHWDPDIQRWDSEEYVYIGRNNAAYNLPHSPWANPYPIKAESERVNAIRQYREYIIPLASSALNIETLRGKTLVCWCSPKPCHGDVLLELLQDAQPAPQPPTEPPIKPERSPAQIAHTHLLLATAWAWKLKLDWDDPRTLGYPGRMVNFLTNRVNASTRGTEWDQHRIEIPATPGEIVAFRLWWDTNPDTKEHIFPSTPETINRRFEQFRAVSNRARLLEMAAERLPLILGEGAPASPAEDTPITDEQKAEFRRVMAEATRKLSFRERYGAMEAADVPTS